MKIGIIGATGWLGSALGRRLLANKIVQEDDLILFNRSGPRADYHGCRGVIWARDITDLARRSEVIVVSVRPEDWPGLGLIAPDRLVLSFMAGVRIAALAATQGRVIRAMPNAAAEIGRSYSPFFAAPEATALDRERTRRIISAIGTTDELSSEAQVDVMTALPGSGAAYPALLAEAMLGFAREQGLSEDIACRAVAATISGGAELLAGRIGEVGALLDAYRAYRGPTGAGIDRAIAEGFSGAVKTALVAATKKASEMG
ncbi:pyrroline-5-carboxylate reductase family protein [Paracoccus aminophilus]|uniref:Pyrroline-5-carboxylate reductase n=1 Tax=Paracoccus aminophilus JCM 7686 TaxID=1367847 RepID=S5XUN9_PARAH|nr:pyrroline-5-carboxylate reductase dimerization domain-containing protein [Paracoccus aminophilus]AGT11219.1 pyrroline-5-carboxylate reductase [Paracoccus aminophilus JCM 7686]